MLERLDVAVYDAFSGADAGEPTTGILSLDLEEGAAGWALDENNRPVVITEAEAAVGEAGEAIRTGALAVHGSMTQGKHPY